MASKEYRLTIVVRRLLVDTLLLAAPVVLQRRRISYRLSVGSKKAQRNVIGRGQWLQSVCIRGVYKTLRDQS